MSREEFLERAVEAAKKAAAISGFPAGVTVAQAALESRYGDSLLSRRGNNYFGIKAHGKHAWLEMATTEVKGSIAKQVTAKFAKYESMEQCFECRDRLISTGAVYADTRAAAKDADRFIAALAKHWATDPKYAEKLRKVYDANGLREIDTAGPIQSVVRG